MIEAVFISDLHLNPSEPDIFARLNRFIEWALNNTKKIFILGDLFHAWAGDDLMEPWYEQIAEKFSLLKEQGIEIYFMHGNRDFLIGHEFLKLSGLKLLADPSLINLTNCTVLLTHGDRYCIFDKSHQWLRRLTRNKFFISLFLFLPAKFRAFIVRKIRTKSAQKKYSDGKYDAVPEAFLKHMQKYKALYLIHGHTHKPGSFSYKIAQNEFKRHVLSDWDDNPLLMCYDSAKGFYFEQLA